MERRTDGRVGPYRLVRPLSSGSDRDAQVTSSPENAPLPVEGRVPGLDQDGFQAAAEGAKANCPVSKALAGVPEITLDARLAAS